MEYWPPFLVLTVRFLFSGAVALAIGFAVGQRIRLTGAEWRAVVLFGICQNALYLGLFHQAMRTLEAGLAAIIAQLAAALRRRRWRGSSSGSGWRRRRWRGSSAASPACSSS